MKHLFATAAFLLFALSASAQRLRLDISLSGDTSEIVKVLVQPLNTGAENRNIVLRRKNGIYTASVKFSDVGLYNLIVVKGLSQLSVPFSLPPAENGALAVEIDGSRLHIGNTPDNKALSMLNIRMNALDRRLWTQPSFTPQELKELVGGYVAFCDSILETGRLSLHAMEYMKVQAYARAYSAYNSIPHALKLPAGEAPFERGGVLPLPEETLDNSYASLLYSVPQIIRGEIPSSLSLLEKLEMLYSKYKNKPLREYVAASIMSDFLSQHDYSSDFEGGLGQVKAATEKYSLPQVYVNEYMERESAIPGSPFPKNAVLVDKNGDRLDFSIFKGKYVYVDMWASWCVPCCKEVPFLQKLERELEKEDIVFVSVSSDSDVNSWKNKMSELNMHGYQFNDSGNTLGKALNVKSIPFFVIYDKEGCLHTYGAMRPSSGNELKKMLEELE